MSRRATTPEARGKRSHSFGADSSAEKRTKRDDVGVRHNAPRDDDVSAGPSASVSMISSSSHIHGANASGDFQRREIFSSPTSSQASSSSGHSRPRRRSPPHSTTGQSSTRSRPTWQTGPSESNEQSWSRDRERESDRDSREARDTLDSREGERELRTTSPNASQGLTPPGARPSSSSGMLQTQAPRTQAAFVNKLYSMLEDPKISSSGLLYWSADGTSFVCPNPSEFAKDVLPNYFKHNNWQSFVRQLNTYSFNKVSDLYSTANTDPQAWEFRHGKFRRGRPDLLPLIKRKPTRQSQTETPSVLSSSTGDDPDKTGAGWGAGPSHHGAYPRYGSPAPRDYGGPYYPTAHAAALAAGYEGALSRSPPRANVPPALGGRPVSQHSGYPVEATRNSEPPFYPHSHSQPPPSRQQSVLETLSSQVSTLQDGVNRLWSTLQQERYDNASRSLDMTNHLIRMTDLFGDISKTRIPVELLHRQRTDLINRLEVLQAQQAEMSLPPSTGHGDRRLGSSYDHLGPPRSMQSGLHDPHSLHPSHHEPPHMSERTRPATSDAAFHYTRSSPRAYPGHPHRLHTSSGEFRYGLDPQGSSRGTFGRRSSSLRREGDDPEDRNLDFDSKASLRNLLH